MTRTFYFFPSRVVFSAAPAPQAQATQRHGAHGAMSHRAPQGIPASFQQSCCLRAKLPFRQTQGTCSRPILKHPTWPARPPPRAAVLYRGPWGDPAKATHGVLLWQRQWKRQHCTGLQGAIPLGLAHRGPGLGRAPTGLALFHHGPEPAPEEQRWCLSHEQGNQGAVRHSKRASLAPRGVPMQQGPRAARGDTDLGLASKGEAGGQPGLQGRCQQGQERETLQNKSGAVGPTQPA